MNKDLTFALFFGNRGFFPGELIASAREEVRKAIKTAGFNSIELNPSLTRYGAVETISEGNIYAKFIEENRARIDGIILSLPNFGDENGASTALANCNVPILLQAYPDEIGVMGVANRRDAFCGKISIADVFGQSGIKFSIFKPHTCHPFSPEFESQLQTFAGVCNVVKAMRRINLGSFGIRPTAFKTIRYDEIALQRYGINVETFDLLQLISFMSGIDNTTNEFHQTLDYITEKSDLQAVPKDKVDQFTRLYLGLKHFIKEYDLNALAIRCWSDMQNAIGITPCLINGILSEEGFPVACETDICNAIAMYALQSSSGKPSICMDWNNNYKDSLDKCIVFHCGNVSPNQMSNLGKVISHPLLDKGKEGLGGIAWGCNQGRIKSGSLTYLSCKTDCGKLFFYMGQGKITDDKIEEGFFGCAGVAEIQNLQETLYGICRKGYRHHVSMTLDSVESILREAFTTYLGFEVEDFDIA